ncbi:MAG: hypothetical protein ACI9YM_000822 [Brevundimonas sp.]|jgi:uncharacterized protein (TIGR02444 family)|uniref:TIGR02444 family protein n=1 Tax=Brevundimonas sp. TaxID=1871086 RepID=UPI0039E4F8E2
MTLWDWAVRAYGTEGVSETCLGLQDLHEQNVPLLLWAAWTATTGRRPDAETIEAAADTARAWDLAAVAPLRAVRRRLRAPIPDIDDPAREAVRTQVKAIELAAERHLLAALEALAPAPDAAPQPPITALAAAARTWGAVTPRPALVRLAERLPA